MYDITDVIQFWGKNCSVSKEVVSSINIKTRTCEKYLCKPRTQRAWLALRLGPQFTCIKWGMRFLQWEDLLRPIWRHKWKRCWPSLYPSTPSCIPRGGPSLIVSFLSFVDPHSFFLCLSLILIFPTPFLSPSALIYRLPLMGLSWWCGGFLGWWGPSGIYSWLDGTRFSR